MQPFKLALSNNGSVTGLHSIPPKSTLSASPRPLIVGLHGGGYDSQYFDATEEHSAAVMSVSLNVPFISIDRPSYDGTSSILPVPEGSDFNQETGIWLHRYILPKLWSEYVIPNDCNSIVLLCHSLGVMGGVVAASLHAQDEQAAYPLGGLIASGMGQTQSLFMKDTPPSFESVDQNYARLPPSAKDSVMFKPNTVAPEVLAQTERLDAPMPIAEAAFFPQVWLPNWKQKWAAHVVVPVMFTLVDNDPFFEVNEAELEGCARAFNSSIRVDTSIAKGAPHCMELSYLSHGWYARSFGFALECAAELRFSA
nr:uncharacterized protein CTRU02_09730 [Colletotrichum truncatum]KAF6788412.1 hypothetical protein CTRU02_09730 [Colletotrichum truncatum]